MILEADDLADGAASVVLRGADASEDVPDQTRLVGFARPRVHVEDADAGQLLPLGRLVVVPHELVASADAQNDAPVLDDSPEICALRPRKVLGEECLLAVLPSTKEEEVATGGPYG